MDRNGRIVSEEFLTNIKIQLSIVNGRFNDQTIINNL